MTTAAPRELPKQYDHAAAQSRWYRFWEERGYFHSEPDATRTPYTIVIPPPNVTGALHLGHALNNSLQDILIRSKRMQGYNALWMPGTDHAGIATQAVVERRLLEEQKLSRHDLGREKLVERIWIWKKEYEARILGQLKQMGCSCDWERTRFTLDEVCARAVRHTFFHMFKDGLIYRGKRLVNWDTFLQTAVSDDEVFHETVKGFFWHFRYPVVKPKPGEPTHVTIATTRPETMLGDTAVAVHPDPAAAIDRVEGELQAKLTEAAQKDRADIQIQLDDLAERRRTMLPLLIQLRDMARDGRKVMLPLLNREIPLVADEWAKPELGSGSVKITPAHDPNDYEVGKRQNLPMINILNPDGTLNENAGPYKDLPFKKARDRVVADLEASDLMDKVEDREIDLAHSDRSKTEIQPYLADQWFVKMDQLAQSAIDAVEDGRVKIFPSRYAKGYVDWLSEKRDWPVGRQLWWGHRIPIWHIRLGPRGSSAPGKVRDALNRFFATCTLQTEVVISEDSEDWRICTLTDRADAAIMGLGAISHSARGDDLKSIEEALRSLGKWDPKLAFSSDAYDVARELRELIDVVNRDEEVLDTWFSSALWPHSTLGWPDQTPELKYYYPTSTLVTSRDIITLWVARMVLTGLYNVGDVPFHEVFIHPKILDGYGEGMSKSKGNGVDPIDVMDKFGADALRFGLAYLTTETQDVRMPVEFECPHCGALVEQTKKNRVLPRVPCSKCGQDFSTQWASKPDDVALPKAAVVSERFELARNFCNKLWNASRFALLNLEGYTPDPVPAKELAIEDRWVLSRLSTVTRQVTEALDHYHFAEAARVLYDFAWDEFCSFYVEMVKGRLQDAQARPVAQRVLAHTLDTLLRLLHPMIPFITEEVWQLLAEAAPERGIDRPEAASESVMIAEWPQPDPGREDPQIEARFARFQAVLGGLREIRSRQNIPPKTPIQFSVGCDEATVELLRPMAAYFESMAGATPTGWGTDVKPPALASNLSLSGIDVYVDLAGHIDVGAEITRTEKEIEKLGGLIAAKEKKLATPTFVDRAPADVVQRERDGLKELQDRQASLSASLAELRKKG